MADCDKKNVALFQKISSKSSISETDTKISLQKDLIQINQEEKFIESFFNGEEPIENRQDNSLFHLTKKVLKYILKKKKVKININTMVRDLKLKKRRIYDITNVLQGIDYIEKRGKNEIIWKQKSLFYPNIKENQVKNNYNKINQEIYEINKLIKNINQEFNSFILKRGYVLKIKNRQNINKNLSSPYKNSNDSAFVNIINKRNTERVSNEKIDLVEDRVTNKHNYIKGNTNSSSGDDNIRRNENSINNKNICFLNKNILSQNNVSYNNIGKRNNSEISTCKNIFLFNKDNMDKEKISIDNFLKWNEDFKYKQLKREYKGISSIFIK